MVKGILQGDGIGICFAALAVLLDKLGGSAAKPAHVEACGMAGFVHAFINGVVAVSDEVQALNSCCLQVNSGCSAQVGGMHCAETGKEIV